jgi:uncharacterized membrane protein
LSGSIIIKRKNTTNKPSRSLLMVFDFIIFILVVLVELLSMQGCFLLLMDVGLRTSLMAYLLYSFF